MAKKYYKNLNGVTVEMDAEETAHYLKKAAEWEASEQERGYADLRRHRNDRLSATDFYAVSDREISDAMRNYRQALRDLPANTPNPYDVTWPTEP